MKAIKKCLAAVAFIAVLIFPSQNAHAGIFGLIKAILTKAIKAADLKVQQMQNKTLELQNAQKKLENRMVKDQLGQISDWTRKQKEQYQRYFDELKKVKAVIRDYQRVRDILQMQYRITSEYARVWQIVQQDKNFSAQELKYMQSVYTGILNQTLQNVKQLRTITSSYTTEMSDAKRMEIVNAIGEEVQRNYDDLRRFNNEAMVLSLSRTKSKQDNQHVRDMYGIH